MIFFLNKKLNFYLNRIFYYIYKLDLLLKLIFSSKKIVEFYYKIIDVFSLLSLNFNLVRIISDFKH